MDMDRFVRVLCPVEQGLRKEMTSESLLLHEGIPSRSKRAVYPGHSITRRQWQQIDPRHGRGGGHDNLRYNIEDHEVHIARPAEGKQQP